MNPSVILLLAMELFTFILLLHLLIPLHEYGHYLAICLCRRVTPAFSEDLTVEISYPRKWVPMRGYTTSNYFQFLANNSYHHKCKLRIIAISGSFFSTVAYSITLVLCRSFASMSIWFITPFKYVYPHLFYLISHLFVCLIAFNILMAVISFLSFFISKSPQSDLRICFHPERFQYRDTPPFVPKFKKSYYHQ